MRYTAGLIVVGAQAASLPIRADDPPPSLPASVTSSTSQDVADPDADETATSVLRYCDPKTYRAHFAITVRASRSAVRNVIATCPVPVDWPEQQVRLVSESKPAVAAVRVTELPGLGAMLIVRVPALPAGAAVTVERVYEITRLKIECTLDPTELTVPDDLPRDVRAHLKSALDVDDRARRMAKLA